MAKTKQSAAVLVRLPPMMLRLIDLHRTRSTGEIVRSRSAVVRAAIAEYVKVRVQ